MEKLSFFEKLGVLGSNILAHPLFIVLLLVPVVLLALNKRITKKGIIVVYISVIAIVLFVGNTTLFQLFDNLVDGVFMMLYFPNFIALFIVVVLSAIITLLTFLRKKIRKVTKIINITGFAVIQTIFCLILTVVQVNNIDIYKENALYSNNDVLTLMQLLMGTFALQIVTIIIVHAIETIVERLDSQEEEGRMNSIQRKIHKLNEKIKINDPVVSADKGIIHTKPEVIEDKIKPLDKSLIEEEKIAPINLNDEKATAELSKRFHVIKDKVDKPDLFEPMEGIVISKNKKSRRKKPKFVNPPIIYVTPPQELYDQLEKANKTDELARIKKSSASILERGRTDVKVYNVTKEEVRPKEPRFVNKIIAQVEEEANKVLVEAIKKPIELPKQPEPVPEIVQKPAIDNLQTKEPKPEQTSSVVNPPEPVVPDVFKIPAVDIVNEQSENVIIKEPKQEISPVIPIKTDNILNVDNSPKPQIQTKIVGEKPLAPATTVVTQQSYTPSPVQEEKDLVANLKMVDYDKTIDAIQNIRRVYTM